MATIVPMTKLEAVNEILHSIGQAPVNTLDSPAVTDAGRIEDLLDRVLRQVLVKGWHFNTDTEYELTPDSNGNIKVPAGILRIDPTYPSNDFVIRKNGDFLMLYDRTDQTFNLGTEAIKMEVVWGWEFEDLPEEAREYIAMRAGRRYQTGALGSTVLFQFTAEDETFALAQLRRWDNRNANRNMLTSDSRSNIAWTRRINPSNP
jgi:hypothetical protein